MTAFLVKQLAAPLFGVVDQESLLRAKFSAAPEAVGTIEIDAGQIAHVAEHVGIDGTDDVSALKRLVSGGWQEEADRPGSTTLGNFGEIVSYLHLLTRGKKPLRVKSYRQGAAAGADDFPMPDFLLEDGDRRGSVEVKTSCPLDYLDLRGVVTGSNTHRWRELAPCKAIPPRWNDALRQLGRSDASGAAPLHDLVLRGREGVVRFPSDFGVAHIHLVHDQRVEALRAHANVARMKTPKVCVGAERDCWNCLGRPSGSSAAAEVVSIHLHNDPGKLLLLGSGTPGASDGWREAYEGWSRALWARDPALVRTFDKRLVDATEEWLVSTPLRESPDALAVVRGGWDRYLGIAAMSRGLRDVGMRHRFARGQMRGGLDRDSPNEGDHAEVETADVVDRTFFEERSKRSVRVTRRGGGVTINATGEAIELLALTNARRPFGRAEAEIAAQRLIEVALEVFHGINVEAVFMAPLSEVTIRDGDVTHSLGWQLRASTRVDGVVAGVREVDAPLRRIGTAWMLGLSLGDPRVALGAHRDGRVYLRFPRDLVTPNIWGIA